MSLLHLLVEGITQSPHMPMSLFSSFSLLLVVTFVVLPLVTERSIATYLVFQLAWCLLLWVRSVRVVGSQSARRVLEDDARAATLTWLDMLRFAALGCVLKRFLLFEVGEQMCALYCGVIALRTLVKPFAYVVLRMYGGSAVATRFTGFDLSAFFESMSVNRASHATSGPAWRQHVSTNKKATSAATRLSSLAPSATSTDTKNNNDRCVVLDEGPHFNRTARGCLLNAEE
ncbi:hypothetical protein ABB37_03457 [Leptomonas pyrrhocoris]|uniref:Uncharacterized protein n=1 Tax=Leptomonas pyrrhocoris TaxID=157538 RepID=A0A0M9G506_LEPPY|nr:hypothetical protein ABB37_03457 [Leptomonas pyrrhocoris]KPA82377.1 hypothetical protein ABB37_03457 [Leptomonas pyrrhocoris]|eukprot:XP_015660816.1 hypothetical protein ABB37_03457 [Leptomonas pyrrhocoris]